MKKLFNFTVAFLLFSVTPVFAGQYVIDGAHSEIGFAVKHMVITNVKGAFRDYTANFAVEDNKLVSVQAEHDIERVGDQGQRPLVAVAEKPDGDRDVVLHQHYLAVEKLETSVGDRRDHVAPQLPGQVELLGLLRREPTEERADLATGELRAEAEVGPAPTERHVGRRRRPARGSSRIPCTPERRGW